jgi:hypothetical protein
VSETERPWYAGGLRFACRGCGYCCEGPGGYVWVGFAEIEALAAALGLDADAFAATYLRRCGARLALIDGPDGHCVFLQNGRCRVYAVRPVQCRTYPWWPETVASAAAWERERRHCPGVGRGRLRTQEEIEAGLAATKAAAQPDPQPRKDEG